MCLLLFLDIQMKIAIIHEMLIKLWGAEKVVESLLTIFPDADLFTLIYDEKKVGKIFPKEKIKKVASSTQRIYELTKKQRFCLPFMAKAVESLDFSEYDIVIASSSWFAHGAITKPETNFVVYYHSPARYLWDWTNEYKKDIWANVWIKGFVLWYLFKKLRQWDYIASRRSDVSLVNSENVKKRIEKYYRKDSIVVYPPIETKRFSKKIESKRDFGKEYGIKKWNYYIIVSALTEFKKIEIAINYFKNNLEDTLVIIWEWNYKENLVLISNASKNIVFLWAKYGDGLVELMQESIAMIFPGEEDFWIVPIEAMAAGKPVFALAAGWLKESITPNLSWNFFFQKDGSDFEENFICFQNDIKNNIYNPQEIQKESEKFSEAIFTRKIKEIVWI